MESTAGSTANPRGERLELSHPNQMIIEIEDDRLYYSQGDEARFFQGLEGNPAVKKVTGFNRGRGRSALAVRMDPRKLTKLGLWDLIALLWRYERPLKPLRIFAKTRRFAWLKDKEMYWHKSMFGVSKRSRRSAAG